MKLAEKRDKRASDTTVVSDAPAPERGNKVYYDSEVKGFGLRVTAGNARAFVLNYTVDGRERRMTIGAWPAWGVEAARAEAKALRQRIDRGEDPLAKKEERRAALTVADLADRYRESHLLKKRPNSRAADERNLRNHILPALGNRKVEDIRFADVDRLHREISRVAPIQANRVVALLSKLFALAVKWEMRDDNPVKGVEKNAETKRRRYLSGQELFVLSEVLSNHPEKQSVNIVRLLLLTGARRGEVMAAEWSQFDLASGVWIKPGATTKQKTEHRVPLSAPARQLISEMKEVVDKLPAERRSRFLFPGPEDSHQKDIKHFWGSITRTASLKLFASQPETEAGKIVAELTESLKRSPTWAEWTKAAGTHWAERKDSTPPAGLTDAHVHDLRHTYASVLASAGLSLPIIGALLGHTQPQTTARYAHLFDDPLRAATERAGAIISAGAGADEAEVLPLRKT